MEILSVPLILIIVYGVIEVLKIPFKSLAFYNFIPLIAGLLGGALGILSFFMIPSIMPQANFLEAFLVGFCSGLSASGTNQVIKQIAEYNKKE